MRIGTYSLAKDADGMESSVGPDQIAPKEQSDLGLHCLLWHVCPNTKNLYGKCTFRLCDVYILPCVR